MADKRRRQAERERARAEEERRRARARRNRVAGIVAGVAIVALVVALVISLTGSSGGSNVQYVTTPSVDPGTLPGILTTSTPWPINTRDLAARLAVENLPSLDAAEGTTLHIHQHIDIYIRGQHVTLPPDIGIQASGGQILYAPIDVHDQSGIVHVDSAVQRDFSLGEFFDVWGVLFTQTCIGSYCSSGDERLQVFADGSVVTGDPRRVKLLEHEEIVVTFGTPDQIPTPYPASYRFPAGL